MSVSLHCPASLTCLAPGDWAERGDIPGQDEAGAGGSARVAAAAAARLPGVQGGRHPQRVDGQVSQGGSEAAGEISSFVLRDATQINQSSTLVFDMAICICVHVWPQFLGEAYLQIDFWLDTISPGDNYSTYRTNVHLQKQTLDLNVVGISEVHLVHQHS